MRYIIITDTHINHKKLCENGLRPDDFEYKIIVNCLSELFDDDILIHLGDVSLGDDKSAHETLMSLSNCKKWLLLGNHDHRSDSWYIEHGWDFVGKTMSIKRFGYRILFSHDPQPNLSEFDINIHGHFHNTDHKTKDPTYNSILCNKHFLIFLEHEYKPLTLKSIIRKWEKGYSRWNGS